MLHDGEGLQHVMILPIWHMLKPPARLAVVSWMAVHTCFIVVWDGSTYLFYCCLGWQYMYILLLCGMTVCTFLAQVCTASIGDGPTTREVPRSCTPHFLHGLPLGVTVSPAAFVAWLLVFL